jgi:hypothetical protein
VANVEMLENLPPPIEATTADGAGPAEADAGGSLGIGSLK